MLLNMIQGNVYQQVTLAHGDYTGDSGALEAGSQQNSIWKQWIHKQPVSTKTPTARMR